MYCPRFLIPPKKKSFGFGWNRTRVPTRASLQRWPLGHPNKRFKKIEEIFIFAHVDQHRESIQSLRIFKNLDWRKRERSDEQHVEDFQENLWESLL